MTASIWFVTHSGICLLQAHFGDDNRHRVDEALMGGFIAAIFAFSKTLSVGVDSIAMGESKIYVFSDKGVICCLEVEKKAKDIHAKETVSRLHHAFIVKYSEQLTTESVMNSDNFVAFRNECINVLDDMKIIPKEYVTRERNRTFLSTAASTRIGTLIQNLLRGDDPKKVAEELKSTFVSSRGVEAKELRRSLVDIDKLAQASIMSEYEKRALLSLTSELRSFATIDEWLGT